MYVLGTAGHIDHGKSVLVRALTGIDPDRLPEEKKREMTIDLGFAWLKLPSGREVSIVDVPGHERLVKNMLAGVGGIDLALLIIAADEGVMPQTKEHLAILDLLNVERGIVVITKRDLVDEEGLGLAIIEAEEVIKGTTLAQAPIVAVSAVSGEGLPDLIASIDYLLDFTPQRRDIGRPRLAIDRVFTMKGFGTVVTGTLVDGQLNVSQEVEILPPGLKGYIRGLETHKRGIGVALPGSRVAANLSGVSTEELKRGMVVTTPGWLKPTQLLDAKLRAVSDLPRHITHNISITFHSGASEVAGKVRLLDKEKLWAGESGWVQVSLARSVAIASGDLFVIRSTQGTLGGGEIVDAHPKRHRRFQPAVIKGLRARQEGSPEDILLAVLEASGPCEPEKVAVQCNFSEAEVRNRLESLAQQEQVVAVGSGPHQFFLSRSRWERLVKEIMRLIQDYHSQFPLRRGMPKEELKSRLRLLPQHFDGLLQKLAEEGDLMKEGIVVRLPLYTVKLSLEQQARIAAFLEALAENPYSPPTNLSLDPELLNLLVEERKVIKVDDKVIFTASAYEEMVNQIIEYIKSQGKITMAEVRDLFHSSRKYVLPLLEYLDQQKITRRVGDERVLR
jgi:selenocysteine-specific elongation factor